MRFLLWRLHNNTTHLGNYWHLWILWKLSGKHGMVYKLKGNSISDNLVKILESFLAVRHRRVFLNGRSLMGNKLMLVSHRVLYLGPSFFLIHVNDLAYYISSNAVVCWQLLPIVLCKRNWRHVKKISMTYTNWAYLWKMIFNADISKQAVELYFQSEILTWPWTYI